MRVSRNFVRPLAVAVLAACVVAGLSGCQWFRKSDRGDYTLAPEARPLEVPPDLNLPDTSGAAKLPNTASALAASAPAPAVSGTGFRTGGSRDEVFGKLEPLLKATEGLTIASSAALLGVYDVTYAGSNFLVRVTAVEGGAYVAAVDPRGLPASGEGPTRLIAALKAQLGGG